MILDIKFKNILIKSLDHQYSILFLIILIMIYPLRELLSVDEEEFRFAVISTVLHGRAILDGYYPFWSSSFGFGIPQPFLINFNFHPLFLLFATKTDVAIILFYFIHLSVGSFGMLHLCRQWKVAPVIAIVCSLSYLLSSPTLNYLYTDFWLTTLFSWSLLPVLFIILNNLLTQDNLFKRWFYSTTLGLTLGLMILNGHLSHVLLYVVALSFFVLSNWNSFISKKKWFLYIALISFLISANSLYKNFHELSYFDSNISLKVFQESFGKKELWGLFLKPIAFVKLDQINNFNLSIGSRIIWYGFPFTIFGYLLIFGKNQINETNIHPLKILFVCCMLIFIFRFKIFYSFITSIKSMREPVIVIGLLLAGIGLTHYFNQSSVGRLAVITICCFQVIVMLIGAYPFWNEINVMQNQGIKDKNVLRNVISGSSAINSIKKEIIKDEGRVFISPEVCNAINSRRLMSIGFSLNSLPFYGIRIINSVFKGISYKEFCPDIAYVYGGIRGYDNCRVKDEKFYDITGIKYIIKFRSEYIKKDLHLLSFITSSDDREIGLYKNMGAWPEINKMRYQNRKIGLKAMDNCNQTGFLCADLSNINNMLVKIEKIVSIKHKHGEITLKFEKLNETSKVMVTEYFRPEWKAKVTGEFGIKNIKVEQVLGVFVGLEVPKGSVEIKLSYKPLILVILEIICIVTIVLCVFLIIGLCVILKKRIDVKKMVRS